MSGFLLFHPLSRTHMGDVAILLGAVTIAVRACYYELFIDESDSPPSEIANEERGIIPTLITRALMISIMLAVAGFAIWKLFTS